MFGVYGEFTLFPPVDSVYQPLNVYPSFVGVGNVTTFAVYSAVNVPSPFPNVYVVLSLIFPLPEFIHLLNVFVCTILFVLPLSFNVTV